LVDRPRPSTDAPPSFSELLELAHQGRLNGSLTRGLVESHVQNLFVVGPGQTNGKAELDGLRPLLEALSSDVHVTVIAGPALLEDPDATIFAWTTRSVLWAIETGEVTEVEAKEAASRLTLAGVEAFGIAMVNVKSKD
jgi:Mrp family chromosome partitioning ATPase